MTSPEKVLSMNQCRKLVNDSNCSRQTKLFNGSTLSLQTVDCPEEIYFNNCSMRLKGHSLNSLSSRKCCINEYVGEAYVKANFANRQKLLIFHLAEILAKLF